MDKKKIKKIQDFDRSYKLLRYYVDSTLKLSYKKIIYVGTENIPQDGAIIYAPNHTNALMDALVLLAIDEKPKVFVARADIFKNRTLAKIFTFLKIMPIMRQRDGFNEIKKNQETIDKAVDVLKDKIPFCIFPEGTHQAKYSLLPLSKGIFRIAFQAQEMMPQMPLYIIPVGLRYGNYFTFLSTIRVEIGKPINVSKFIAEHTELNPIEQTNAMKELLTEHLRSCIFFIENDQDYNAMYEICNIAQPFEIKELLKEKENKGKHKLELQTKANNKTLKRISTLKESNPDKAEELLKLGNEAKALREKRKISIDSVPIRCSIKSNISKMLFTLISLPYTILAFIFALPVLGICQYLFTLLKDPAFKNSVRYLVNLLAWPILMIIYSIIAFILLPWQWAIPAILLILPAPIVAYDLCNKVKLFISDIKLQREKRLKKIYNQIKEIIISHP